MKRRNFLSGLLAAPLALKARLAQLFGQGPVNPCAAPRIMLTDRQLEICRLLAKREQIRQREIVQLLAEGKSAGVLWPSPALSKWAEKAIGRRGAWLN